MRIAMARMYVRERRDTSAERAMGIAAGGAEKDV